MTRASSTLDTCLVMSPGPLSRSLVSVVGLVSGRKHLHRNTRQIRSHPFLSFLPSTQALTVNFPLAKSILVLVPIQTAILEMVERLVQKSRLELISAISASKDLVPNLQVLHMTSLPCLVMLLSSLVKVERSTRGRSLSWKAAE